MNISTLDHLIKNQKKYVLQNSMNNIGNMMLFWANGQSGYTTDISNAHLFTQEEALLRHKKRKTDIPHRLGDVLRVASIHVDQDARVRPDRTIER